VTCDPMLRSHGTQTAYRAGCRCPDAIRDQSLAHKAYRLRVISSGPQIVDATGTRRRLQALQRIGWTQPDLAAMLGSREYEVYRWTQPSTVRIARRTRNKVAALYARLSDTPKPNPDRRTIRRAERHGWLPPIWWDDDTIDDPNHPAGSSTW
jgi:hypothetical protein